MAASKRGAWRTRSGLVFALALVASASSAIEMTQVGGPTVVDVGDTFTIELALDNASRDVVQGIEVDMSGLAGTANVVSGRATRYNFVVFCHNASTCFGGVHAPLGGFWDYDDLTAGGYATGDDSVELMRALGFNPTTADGTLDPGVDGDGSPVDVRITLQAIGVGQLSIVGRYSNGTDVLPFPGDALTIQVVPEPGTASLLALGLSLLSGLRPGRFGRTSCHEPNA